MKADDSQLSNQTLARIGAEQIMYVLPLDAVRVVSDDTMDAMEVWSTLWRDRWIIVAITMAFAVLGVSYALFATKWYRAEMLLVPAQEKSSGGLVASFGGLASLAGIRVGGGDGAEPLAVLRSREFTADFIERHKLVTTLFADQWNAAAGRWEDEDPEDWPDTRDAVWYFNNYIRDVEDDPKTGLVKVSIQWKNPETAASWAEMLVNQLNERMRDRALRESTSNIAFLQSELKATNVIPLQQSIGRLLESELQKLMLARGNVEFSFRVVDKPGPPKRPSWPKGALVVLISVVIGVVTAVLVVYLRRVLRLRRESRRGHKDAPSMADASAA